MGLSSKGLDILAEKHARAGTIPHGYLYPELHEIVAIPQELLEALHRRS